MYDTALLVDDPLFMEHRSDGPHPECPERLTAARAAIEAVKAHIRFRELSPHDATDDELGRVHSERYLRFLGHAADHSRMLDEDTYLTRSTVAVSRRAAGASVSLVDALLRKEAHWGAALVRPPGHHARPEAAMGFCYLNNVAVAAAEARARGAERVLVLDWDVHHGNGTQEIFYADPSVLYVSLHQFPFYPGTGARDELGVRDGRGFTANIPLSKGASDRVYRAAFERIVCPLAEEYRPNLVLLSAGYDAHALDPLAEMELSGAGYAELTEQLCRALRPECPVGLVLEGGYDLDGLRSSLEATLLALAGLKQAEPLERASAPQPELSPLYERELELARSALKPYWPHL